MFLDQSTSDVIRVNQYILFALLCTAFAILTTFCGALYIFGRKMREDITKADVVRESLIRNCDANIKLLSLLQGWTVVIASDKTKEAAVAEKSTKEVKDKMSELGTKVEEVPAKVVDAITHLPPSESGSMPTPTINPAT